jgi:hypothetical protein
MRVRKKDKVVSSSITAWHYSVLSQLDYMGQRGIKHSDITTSSKNSYCLEESKHFIKKKKWPLHIISQNKHQLCKKM